MMVTIIFFRIERKKKCKQRKNNHKNIEKELQSSIKNKNIFVIYKIKVCKFIFTNR